MTPILITLVVSAPILALGVWLYLQRQTLTPRIRIALMFILFLFVLVSGPAIFVMWQGKGIDRDILSSGRGGQKLFVQFPLLWLIGVLGVAIQLFRLWRKKGEL